MISFGSRVYRLLKKIPYLPCPYAFGRISCGIYNPCAARVLRKFDDEPYYFCYYIDAPIANNEDILRTAMALILMLKSETQSLIRDLNELLLDKTMVAKQKDKKFFLLISTKFGDLISSRDACISCVYRKEQSNSKEDTDF